MQTSNKKDFFTNKITFTNFILAIFVMFIHSENIALYKNASPFVSNIEYFLSYTLGNLAVPTFFIMSAYLFYRKFQPDQLTAKIKRRIKSILIPYLIWNLLYFILFYIITFFPGIRSFMITEHFVLSPRVVFEAVFFHKYNKIFWFMQQLIYFIILSPFIYYLVKKKWGIIIAAVFLITGTFYPTFPNNQYGIRIDMIVYWISGCYFAIHTPTFFERKGSKNEAFMSAFMCIILLAGRFILEYINDNSTLSRSLSPLLLFINVTFLWFALNLVIPSSSKWWMRISFFIYMTHPLLIDAFKKIYAYFLPDTTFFCLSNYFISVLFSLVIITVSAGFLIKYFPKLWNILNGGRTP